MKRIVSLGMAIALLISSAPKPVKANPVLLLAPELCATGVGCVLVGTVVIGGVLYYVYKTHQGKRVYSDHKMIDDPEEQANASGRHGDSGVWDEPIYAPTYSSANQKCKSLARKYGVTLVKTVYDKDAKQFRCKFTGGQNR